MSTANSRRTALITGASRGLGAAIALELGAMGVNAAVNSGATVLLITQSGSAFEDAGCASSSVQPGLATTSPDFSGTSRSVGS